MTIWVVFNKVILAERLAAGDTPAEAKAAAKVFRYSADAPVEWHGMSFADCTHETIVEAPAATPITEPRLWRIHKGSFFDRFGSNKMYVLSHPDMMIQGFITDVLARTHINLYERRDEILGALQYIQSKGIQIDTAAILDVMPTGDEVFND